MQIRVVRLLLLLLWVVLVAGVVAIAQEDADPALIRVEAGESPATVRVVGEAGAIPGARPLALQNIYTGEVAYSTARPDGSFVIEDLRGLPSMPYRLLWPERLPDALRRAGGVPADAPGLVLHQALPTEIGVGGRLARGSGVWWAAGRLNAADYAPGERLSLRLGVTFSAPGAAADLPLSAGAALEIVPLSDPWPLRDPLNSLEVQALTASGLPVAGLMAQPRPLDAVTTAFIRSDAEARTYEFSLSFDAAVPDDLPTGLYILALTGTAQVAGSAPFDWYDNRIFGTEGSGSAGSSRTVIPVILRVGDAPPQPDRSLLTGWSAPEEALTHYPTASAPLAANELRLVPVVLPGTPLVVGDAFAPNVALLPPVILTEIRAETTLTVYPLDGAPQVMRWQDVTGPVLHAHRVDQPGHYVVDYEVQARDADGQLWHGRLRTAGVITTADAPAARGLRGIADYTRAPQPWYDTRVYPSDAPDLPPIANMPTFSGDVALLPDSDNSGLQPVLMLPDDQPVMWPDFALISAVRPAVWLRQAAQVGGPLARLRWHNDDLLGGQIGAGAAGNRPGDMVFLFGGVVTETASHGYAALAITTAGRDAARVVPPLREPLLPTGPDRLVFVPHTPEPGQVYTQGDRLALLGNVAPPLPADVTAELTAPSGAVYDLSQQASRFGYVFDPQQTVALDEIGAWTLDVRVTYAGETSAGPLANSVSGGVPGTEGGRYRFFVRAPDSPALNLRSSQIFAGQPVSLTLDVPAGWSDLSAYATISTPGVVLADLEPRISSGRFVYTFSPGDLVRSFPHLETGGRGSGPAAGDIVRLRFALTGLDAEGRPTIATQQATLLFDQLYTEPQP